MYLRTNLNFIYNLGNSTEKASISDETFAAQLDPIFQEIDTNFDGLIEYHEYLIFNKK